MTSNDTPSSAPVAVITGGARGIGLAVAEWFLEQGHRIALLDIDRATLDATATRLADPGRVLAVACDVSDPEQVGIAGQGQHGVVEPAFDGLQPPRIAWPEVLDASHGAAGKG